MFDDGRFILHFNIRIGIRATLIANQHAVALTIVTGTFSTGKNLDLAAVTIHRLIARNPFGDDLRRGVLSDMNHLRTSVGLHTIVGQRHRVKLADGIIALQDHTWIFPSDR